MTTTPRRIFAFESRMPSRSFGEFFTTSMADVVPWIGILPVVKRYGVGYGLVALVQRILR